MARLWALLRPAQPAFEVEVYAEFGGGSEVGAVRADDGFEGGADDPVAFAGLGVVLLSWADFPKDAWTEGEAVFVGLS